MRDRPSSLASSAAFSSAGRSGEVIYLCHAPKAGHPVRCGFSVLTWISLEYWIARRNLSSGGRSADPLTGDDTECVAPTYPRHCEEPTGRANARPMTGSATKQSILPLLGEMDCFASLAMTTKCTSAFPRRESARGRERKLSPQKKRAQGRPGARCTRGLVCKMHIRIRIRAYRFSGNTPAFPAQWFYGL